MKFHQKNKCYAGEGLILSVLGVCSAPFCVFDWVRTSLVATRYTATLLKQTQRLHTRFQRQLERVGVDVSDARRASPAASGRSEVATGGSAVGCNRGGCSVVLCHGGEVTVAAAHLLQHSGQFVQVSVREVLGLPQVQDHARRAGLGGKVVQIPGKERRGGGGIVKQEMLQAQFIRPSGKTVSCRGVVITETAFKTRFKRRHRSSAPS